MVRTKSKALKMNERVPSDEDCTSLLYENDVARVLT